MLTVSKDRLPSTFWSVPSASTLIFGTHVEQVYMPFASSIFTGFRENSVLFINAPGSVEQSLCECDGCSKKRQCT